MEAQEIHTYALKLAALTVVAALFFLITQIAHALSQDIHTSAYLLPDGETAAYLVTFPLGPWSTDLLIPTNAIQSNSDALDPAGAHYYFENDVDDSFETFPSAARLFSSTLEETDGVYRLPAGSTHYFTLIALLAVDGVERVDPEDYRLQLRTIPFVQGTVQQQFNRHELGNHHTPYLDLEDGSTKE